MCRRLRGPSATRVSMNVGSGAIESNGCYGPWSLSAASPVRWSGASQAPVCGAYRPYCEIGARRRRCSSPRPETSPTDHSASRSLARQPRPRRRGSIHPGARPSRARRRAPPSVYDRTYIGQGSGPHDSLRRRRDGPLVSPLWRARRRFGRRFASANWWGTVFHHAWPRFVSEGGDLLKRFEVLRCVARRRPDTGQGARRRR